MAINSFTLDQCGYQPDDNDTCSLIALNTAGSSLKQTTVKTKSCIGMLFCSILLYYYYNWYI